MESLEDILNKVKRLKRDLSAKKIIQAKIVEIDEEILEDSSWNYGMPTGRRERDRMIQPEITQPDTQKREVTRTQLQQIYESSEWYSARYEAGKILSQKQQVLTLQLSKWIEELKKQKESMKVIEVTKEVRLIPDFSFSSDWVSYVVGYVVSTKRKILNKEKIPDTEQKKARQDLKYLYENLPDKNMRAKVGKVLNYSGLRIWLNELFRG